MPSQSSQRPRQRSPRRACGRHQREPGRSRQDHTHPPNPREGSGWKPRDCVPILSRFFPMWWSFCPAWSFCSAISLRGVAALRSSSAAVLASVPGVAALPCLPRQQSCHLSLALPRCHSRPSRKFPAVVLPASGSFIAVLERTGGGDVFRAVVLSSAAVSARQRCHAGRAARSCRSWPPAPPRSSSVARTSRSRFAHHAAGGLWCTSQTSLPRPGRVARLVVEQLAQARADVLHLRQELLLERRGEGHGCIGRSQPLDRRVQVLEGALGDRCCNLPTEAAP